MGFERYDDVLARGNKLVGGGYRVVDNRANGEQQVLFQRLEVRPVGDVGAIDKLGLGFLAFLQPL